MDEFIIFPLALIAAAGIRTSLGWGALAWRDFLLAIFLGVVFWGFAAAAGAARRRRR